MAEVKAPSRASGPGAKPAQAKRGPSVHQIYSLPAPIRTFPLPTFYPGNPLSLFHVASAWLGQVFSPPAAEPAVVHRGAWSETTTAVHVTDEKSMRALWEQGFYGKGSLSRSEPNWLKRERVRRGLEEAHVSEILTVQRRQERAQSKWERARLEQEAIQNTRLEEARDQEARRLAKYADPPLPPAGLVLPVGPLQLLALPNSHLPTEWSVESAPAHVNGPPIISPGDSVGPLAKGKSSSLGPVHGSSPPSTGTHSPNDALMGRPAQVSVKEHGQNGLVGSMESCSTSTKAKSNSRPKSVRFSPKVESTFQLSDPPSPGQSCAARKSCRQLGGSEGGGPESRAAQATELASDADGSPSAKAETMVNREHLQLTPEEAFFLSFGLGALDVSDGESGPSLSTRRMLTRFRQYSYFPPRIGPEEPDLGPDDGFLLHYVVYHHFRSLGWVPRAGIKFGVDWLLYTRGPVFDHAEFGVMVIPSYSNPWWKRCGKQGPRKTWDWLHNSVRVLSHVMKSLVLVYVDVPPAPKFDQALDAGITEALKLYRIREVMVKRWSSNRNR